MRRGTSIAAVLAVLLAISPAAHAGGDAHSSGKSDKPAAPVIPTLKMPRLVAPVIIKGELVRYSHFEVTLILPDDLNKKALSDKVPYIQDALLRDVHATSILKSEDTGEIDETGLKARLLAICVRLAGAGLVKDIELRDIEKAPV